jgi:transposase
MTKSPVRVLSPHVLLVDAGDPAADPDGCGFAVQGEQGGHVGPTVAVGQGLAHHRVGCQGVSTTGDVLPAPGDDQFLLPVGHRRRRSEAIAGG